jgi:hypothetical protein
VTGRVVAPLGSPFPVTAGDRVYDAPADGRERAWLMDVAVGRDGHPVVLYTTYPSLSDHRYRYGRWDGRAWRSVDLAGAGGTISPDQGEPYYTAGATLDAADPRVVYLSMPERPGVWRVQKWVTADGGRSWRARHLTATSGGSQVRPVRVTGQPVGDERFGTLFMSGPYRSFTDYRTGLETTGDVRLVAATVSAPVTARSGTAAGVAVRLRAGAGGPGLGGRRTWVQAWTGHGWTTLASRRTDATGLVVYRPQVRGDRRLRVLVGEGSAREATPVREVVIRAA